MWMSNTRTDTEFMVVITYPTYPIHLLVPSEALRASRLAIVYAGTAAPKRMDDASKFVVGTYHDLCHYLTHRNHVDFIFRD
jgi:hypothetical protein